MLRFFYYIFTVALFLCHVFSYSQQIKNSANSVNLPELPPVQDLEIAEKTTMKNGANLVDLSEPPPPVQDEDEEVFNPCNVPTETEVLHMSVKSWDFYSKTKQRIQETRETIEKGVDEVIDEVSEFIGQVFNNSEERSSDDNNEEESETKYSVIDKIAYSHFKLAELIKSFPNSFVFHEFSTQIYDTRIVNSVVKSDISITPQQLEDIENPGLEHIVQLVQQQFPLGFPEKYENMNTDQRHTLVLAGAAHTLLFLNEIPLIFPSITFSDYKKYDLHGGSCTTQYDIFNNCPYFNNVIKVLRAEKLAFIVENFLKYFSDKNNKQMAILVYDGDQDLREYFSDRNFYRMPDNCLSIETE